MVMLIYHQNNPVTSLLLIWASKYRVFNMENLLGPKLILSLKVHLGQYQGPLRPDVALCGHGVKIVKTVKN